jgi:hypothetical protein
MKATKNEIEFVTMLAYFFTIENTNENKVC